MPEKAVAVVTGVSSGLGSAIARELTEAGYCVYGTVRSASGPMPEAVERLVLDVRDEASIATAIGRVLDREGRIDALVNNAGASILGAIEETDTDQAQALFEVNFFGAVRVTRHVLPVMRAQRSGRVLFVSSVVGFLPAPFMGFYAASKHALEGYCESLDHEVRGFGVRALLLEPGFMKTNIDKNATAAARAIDDYAAVRARVGGVINESVEHGEDPAIAAKVVARVLRDPSPKLRYPVGKRSGMLATLRRYLPASMFDRSFRKEFKMDPAG